MINNTSKYIFVSAFLVILVACSTKRDTFLARNSHALSTRFNILYNGKIALDKGILGISENTTENFWKELPVEKMEVTENIPKDGRPKNANFEIAEAKATKAIQKHSMNIGGREKNYQIDEAYLLLGQARYYDQRFIPALDAFNYILYKYPNGSNIYEAKIWREKTNIRLGNEAVAIKNTNKLIKDNKLGKQEFADANAILASAFLSLEEKDSAVVKLKLANKYTKRHDQQERYSFLLGQLYEEAGQKDSALYFYQTVIDMNRKAERKFVIQAYAKTAKLFDFKKLDCDVFVKNSKKIIKDRENRPYLDLIFYNMGIFYDNNNNKGMALEFYNASLKKNSTDPYLNASNYRNIGNLYFKHKEYSSAAKNYDKSLALLDVETREYLKIKKIRKNLDEVIINEAVANRNDSIIKVVAMSSPDQLVYYENYIEKLKESDKLKQELEDKQKDIESNSGGGNATSFSNPDNDKMPGMPGMPGMPDSASSIQQPGTDTQSKTNTFYFYNASTIAYGKLQFKKIWGSRANKGYWRASAVAETTTDNAVTDTTAVEGAVDTITATKINEKYIADYYIKQLPKSQMAMDSIVKERNVAYYQLGVVYKEKFKEYNLASTRLEQLLVFKPEEKLILPTKYNLYKIYEITDTAKAEALKKEITEQYPNSRYAQIINNLGEEEGTSIETPEGEYKRLFKMYEEESFKAVLQEVDTLIEHFTGEPIVSKFELLKANTIGKLSGLVAYKKAIEYVADNFANTEEGKSAVEILKTQIPLLDQLNFTNERSRKNRIIFRVAVNDDKTSNDIEKKIRLFMADENIEKVFYTCDFYTDQENFISIQGIQTEAYAKFVRLLFSDNKKYKITTPGIVISSENYQVVQIKKNIEEYLLQKQP